MMERKLDTWLAVYGKGIYSHIDRGWWDDDGGREGEIVTDVKRAINAIEHCRGLGGTVFVCGNGGSMATALHFVCDMAKVPQGCPGPSTQTICLGANGPLLTAIANDSQYRRVFADDLLRHRPSSKDALLAISASGNSENVLDALEAAEDNGMLVIGLTGFDGGCLRAESDISIHVDAQHFGIVEDLHLIICHMIAYWLAGSDPP